MSTAFLHSLADMLGTSEAEARQALADFAARVRARVAAEGRATYPGLGTFMQAGGRLAFEPDPAIALVVNHRYAGMEPISLSAGAPPTWQSGLPDDEHPLGPAPEDVYESADATPTEAPEEDTTELPPLFASDETLMALRDAARDLDTPPSEEAAQWADDMIEQEADETPGDLDVPEGSVLQEMQLTPTAPPVPIEPPPPPVDDDANPFVEDDVDDDWEEEPPVVVAPLPPEPAAVPPPPVAPPEPAPQPRLRPTEPASSRRARWPLILIAVVAGAALVAWLMRPVAVPPPPPVAQVDTAAVAPPDTAEATPPAPVVEEGPLRGTAPITAGSGFTIVVGGADTQADADALAAPFRAEGFRTAVLPGRTRAGATIYRVSLGQFGTRAEALRALDEVQSNNAVPPDAWVNTL